MLGEENKIIGNVGVIAGYALSYTLFTTILFFVLSFLNKIPQEWSILHIMPITAIIALVGALTKWVLK